MRYIPNIPPDKKLLLDYDEHLLQIFKELESIIQDCRKVSLLRKKNSEIVDDARSEGRIIVTLNKDLVRYAQAHGVECIHIDLNNIVLDRIMDYLKVQ